MDVEHQRLEWRLRSKMKEYGWHVEQARRIIREAHDAAAFAICWSGGKDSTAMCHLVKSLYPETPIITQFDDCDWPEKRPYIERVALEMGWSIVEAVPDFSVWDAAKRYRIGEEALCGLQHPLTVEGFLEPLNDARKRVGCDGLYIGLRAQESKARRMNRGKRGDLYRVKSGVWHCMPMAAWRTDDVFAYLTASEVEINPCYFHNHLLKTDEIRLSWALPTPQGYSHGDMEHIRKYYPEQYRKLRDEGVI